MGGKSSTSTSTVKIPPEVLARYNAVNARAEDVAERPFQIYGTDPSAFVAQINAQQQQGIQNINTAAGAYKPYFEQARTAGTAGMASAQPQDLDIGRYLNPYQQQVIDATMRQMGQANEQAQSGALGTAASSGAFGGDRAGIAAANLANQQGLAMGSTLAGLNAQNYQQALAAAQQQQGLYLGATQADLARLMQGGQFLAGLGQAEQQAGLQGAEAQINAGTLQQQTEQAGLSALYNQFQQQQAYDFQVAQFLANIAMGTGALSGSTTTTTQPTSWFSDRRLKEDIRRIGHTDDGLPIYKYKYKGDDNHQTHIGFMADEVEQVKPEAVGVSGGYKTVDYDRATKADGGGVAGPYGAGFGSQNPYGAGYVPPAVLPVGELMVADPGMVDNARETFAQQMQAAANFGENMVKLKDTFGKGGDFYDLFSRDTNYRGGVVHRATGGATYLQGQKAGVENPVSGQGYVADTLAQQEKQKPAQLQSTGSAPGAPGSTGLQDLASAAGTVAGLGTAAKGIGMLAAGTAGAGSTLMSALPFLAMSDRRMKHDIRRIGRTDHGMPIYSFKYKGDDREQTHIGFMADEVEKHHPDAVMTGDDGYKRVDYGQAHKFYQGGVVRPGYATDGAVAPIPATEEEIIRRRLLTGDVPAAATLGSQPEARVTPVAEEAPTTATAERPRLSFPTEGGVAPAAVERLVLPLGRETPIPTGGVVPAAADFPVAQPAQAAPAAVTGVVVPQPEAPSGWETFGPRVRQRESGGDYDALYNFSNREGGPFAGRNVTDMTVDEALAFADPSGPYGRYVAGVRPDSQYGVATPLGAYQIVGSTLRGVKEGMGLTGDEKMTPELQDQMAQWLYQNYGETPWAVPGGVGGGLTVSASNGPAGVSGGYGIGGDKPYEDRTRVGQMFYDPNGRVNEDALLSILSGIGTMASSPSLYLGSAILQGIGGAANTYAGLKRQRSDIRLQDAQTADYASQLIKNSLIKDEATGLTYIPLVGGGTQRFSDWLKNPAGRAMAGTAADQTLRRIGNDLMRQGLNLDKIDPEQLFRIDATPLPSGSPTVTGQPETTTITGPGLPVPTVERPVTEVGTFPISDAERTFIDNNLATIEGLTPAARERIEAGSAAIADYAAAEATAATGTFRNLNELAYVVAEASGDASLGPFGNLKAGIDGILQQAAATVGMEYDGSAASQSQLLSKLSQLQANEITSGTAAAELFLRNRQMFPDISSDPEAASEITAAAIIGNMENFERGAYVRNIEAAMAQEGPFVNLNGVDQEFTKRTRNVYQTEKGNIATLLKASSNQQIPENVRAAIKEFLKAANAGEYESAEQAQKDIRDIFSMLPGEHRLSSGLGRYFVQ